jgi:hypothetical protein
MTSDVYLLEWSYTSVAHKVPERWATHKDTVEYLTYPFLEVSHPFPHAVGEVEFVNTLSMEKGIHPWTHAIDMECIR